MHSQNLFDGERPTMWQKHPDGRTREFYGEWHLSPTPAHELKVDIVNVHGCRHDLHVLLPLCVSTDEAYRYFSDDRWYNRYEDDEYDDYDEDGVRKSKKPKQRLLNENRCVQPGFVHFPTHDSVEVRLGSFVPSPPDEQEVAEHVYALQHQTKEWHGTHVSKDFYGSCVFPHVMNGETKDPFTWAYERAVVANGYAMTMEGKDAPPLWIEEPYTKLARHACRKKCEPLRAAYPLHVEGEKLLQLLHAMMPDAAPLPEACFLVLEHPTLFTEATLRTPQVRSFLEKLEVMLRNGLSVQNLSACLRKAQEYRTSPEETLAFALALTESVFGSEDCPWWFCEDQALTDWEPLTMDRELETATCAGAAYREVRAARAEHEAAFLELEGIPASVVLPFLVEVTRDYGIGNPKRLANVVRTVLRNLEQTPPQERLHALLLLKKHIHEHRPQSAIVGRMEGEDVHFELPGITPLIAGMEGLTPRDACSPLGIGVEQVGRLRETLSKPPLQRLGLQPVLGIMHNTTRLLIPHVLPAEALLPAPNTPTTQTGPLTQLVEFYERLKGECGGLNTQVANVYFTFCATRFPNPLSPPPGFLAFVHRFCELPDPNYRWTMMEHPRDREHISKANQRNTVRRYQILSHLLDAWLSDLATWEDVWQVCEWMTQPPPQELRAGKLLELQEREREYELDRIRRREIVIAEHRLECTTGIAKLLQQSIRTRDVAEKEALEWKLRRLVAKRDELPREVRDDDEYHADQAARTHQSDSLENQADRELRVEQNEVCQARVLTVAEGMHALEKLHFFVGKHLLSSESLRAVTKDLLTQWKAGAVVSVAEPAVHEESQQRELHQWKQDLEHLPALLPDVINQEPLLEILRAVPIAEALPRLFAELKRAQELFAQTESLVRRVVENIHRDGFRLEPRMYSLDESVERLWEKSKLLRPEGLEKIRESYGWLHRHVRLQGLMRATVEQTSCADDFSMVNAISHKTVAALVALTHLDGEEHLTRLTNDENERMRTELIAKDLAPETAKAEGSVLEWRKQSLGLCPVGAKIHVLHAIDETKFNALVNVFGYERSGFYLLHANTCLIIPPMPSSQELAMIIGLLAKEGVIDLDHPEIQICLPGRLPPQDCAVLGSTMLLTTDCGVRYQEEAFCTSHDHLTGARMLAYDAGATPLDLPFMTSLPGRTDILGRRSLRDLPDYQLVGTVLAQDRAGRGPFAHLAEDFRTKQREILAKHGLDGVLSAAWIAMDRQDASNNNLNKQHYRKAVQPCVEAYFASAENGEPQAQTGIIHELRQLLDWLRGEVSTIQKFLPADPRYKSDCDKVLQLSSSSHV